MARITTLAPYGSPGKFYSFKAKVVTTSTDAADFEKYAPFPSRLFTDRGFPTTGIFSYSFADQLLILTNYQLSPTLYTQENQKWQYYYRKESIFSYSSSHSNFRVIKFITNIIIPLLKISKTMDMSIYKEAISVDMYSLEGIDQISTALITELYKKNPVTYEELLDSSFRCCYNGKNILISEDTEELGIPSLIASHLITHNRYKNGLTEAIIASVIRSYLELEDVDITNIKYS